MIKRTVIISIILLIAALCLPCCREIGKPNAGTNQRPPTDPAPSADPVKHVYSPGKDSGIGFTSL